jgi:hypothetical protein
MAEKAVLSNANGKEELDQLRANSSGRSAAAN